MSDSSSTIAATGTGVSPRAPSPKKTLRRLFLTLFLRGRSARNLEKAKAPTSIGQKLAVTLALYALFGIIAVMFAAAPIFALAAYLHAMTFAFLGMFVASAAGEVLFNKEEHDILLHRPVDPKDLLWAKLRVLVETSLWIAGAFNLAGLITGTLKADGGIRFALAHAVSVALQAVFVAGCVVMVYQLCLRWCGRERLDGMITTAQVLLSVGAMLGSQILPQFLFRVDAPIAIDLNRWWFALFPPVWFAGFDVALSGSREPASWGLALLAVAGTTLVAWIAFVKLARDYELGVQRLSETTAPRVKQRAARRWIDAAVQVPPLSWWLRDPVERATFLLTSAYLLRDRDVKLRVYPAIMPMMAMPLIFLIQDITRGPQEGIAGGIGSFGIAFAGAYLGIIPMLGINLLQFSQQWQAGDVFRVAPLIGPAKLCHGTRRAALCFLAVPALIVFSVLVLAVRRDPAQLLLLLPGAIALPVFSLLPLVGGSGVPLSLPTEEAKSASRGLLLILASFAAFPISGLAMWAWIEGMFGWFIAGETVLAIVVYALLRRITSRTSWKPLG